MLYCEGDETLEEVAQRGCGHPDLGGAQGQAGWGSVHSGLLKGVPALGKGWELDDLYKSPFYKPWFIGWL